MGDQSDLFGAKEARDEALQRVGANSGPWRSRALNAVRNMPHGWTGTAEDLRVHLTRAGLELPHHHNAWGELTKACVERRYLVRTGEQRHMRSRKSHARLTPVYRIAGGRQ